MAFLPFLLIYSDSSFFELQIIIGKIKLPSGIMYCEKVLKCNRVAVFFSFVVVGFMINLFLIDD
jgi:hypothetical protein